MVRHRRARHKLRGRWHHRCRDRSPRDERDPGVTSADSERARHLELVAVDVAGIASDYVRTRTGQAESAATKSSPTDVVTHTDMECEQLIRSELLARCPGSSIVGEEFDDDQGGNNVGWIVDPIDGTVNFLYDLPVVSVSIAATIDGEVVAGAVADIHHGETFSAALGAGARLTIEPIAASTAVSLDAALIATGFSYDARLRAQQAQLLIDLLPSCRDIRCMGSAALNLCWVGCGRLDGYFERDLKVYDYAAGALIAAEAGATVELPSDNRIDLTIAAASSVFGQLRLLVEAEG
ncbi:MAG: inositol monophosphatase [Acidimicrobiia bacterium]|nr:inositol monophosphatase [Acidimicrobiia bacterium]